MGFELSGIWAFITANPILILVGFLLLTGKLDLKSILAFFTGGGSMDDVLKKLLEELLKAKAAGDKDSEEAISKTLTHCINCKK